MTRKEKRAEDGIRLYETLHVIWSFGVCKLAWTDSEEKVHLAAISEKTADALTEAGMRFED